MLRPLLLLIALQFLGEALVRLVAIPVPGPVVGLTGLVGLCALRPALFGFVEETAEALLKHLSLLFVPAGVGVLQHMGLLAREWWPILGVLVLSTAITLVATALTFQWLARPAGPDGTEP
jgi:holin-like protein